METSEDGGRSKEAFKDAIDNDVLKEKQINMTYILPCFQCYQKTRHGDIKRRKQDTNQNKESDGS